MRYLTSIFSSISVLFILFGTWSCQALDRWTKYSLTYKSKPILKDSLPSNTDTFYELKATFEFDFEDDLEFRAVNPDKIEKAEMYEIQLAIKNDSEVQTFNFVKTLRVYLEAEGFERRLISEIPEVGISEKFLVFKTSEVDGILKLLEKNTFDLIIEFNTDEEKPGEVHFDFETRFEIDAEQFFI